MKGEGKMMTVMGVQKTKVMVVVMVAMVIKMKMEMVMEMEIRENLMTTAKVLVLQCLESS